MELSYKDKQNDVKECKIFAYCKYFFYSVFIENEIERAYNDDVRISCHNAEVHKYGSNLHSEIECRKLIVRSRKQQHGHCC